MLDCVLVRSVGIVHKSADDSYGVRKEYTKMAMRLKTGIEPIWFEIMPCASFYSVLRSTPEVSRMFTRNLEYTSTFYNKT